MCWTVKQCSSIDRGHLFHFEDVCHNTIQAEKAGSKPAAARAIVGRLNDIGLSRRVIGLNSIFDRSRRPVKDILGHLIDHGKCRVLPYIATCRWCSRSLSKLLVDIGLILFGLVMGHVWIHTLE